MAIRACPSNAPKVHTCAHALVERVGVVDAEAVLQTRGEAAIVLFFISARSDLLHTHAHTHKGIPG